MPPAQAPAEGGPANAGRAKAHAREYPRLERGLPTLRYHRGVSDRCVLVRDGLAGPPALELRPTFHYPFRARPVARRAAGKSRLDRPENLLKTPLKEIVANSVGS